MKHGNGSCGDLFYYYKLQICLRGIQKGTISYFSFNVNRINMYIYLVFFQNSIFWEKIIIWFSDHVYSFNIRM